MRMGKISLSYDTDRELIMQPFYFSVSDVRAVTASVFVCLWRTGFRISQHTLYRLVLNYLKKKTYVQGDGKRQNFKKYIYIHREVA